MNMDSESGITQEMYDHFATYSPRKFGSFTDNDDLGKSHYHESIESIHYLCKFLI